VKEFFWEITPPLIGWLFSFFLVSWLVEGSFWLHFFLAEVLAQAMDLMLVPMETALKSTEYLMGEKMSWVDVAIFPFIRQFAMADLEKFNDLPLPALRRWLNQHLESDLFLAVMHKYPVWIDE
jgi:glutathione S-transferase